MIYSSFYLACCVCSVFAPFASGCHRLRLLNHDIVSVKGKHCIVAAIVPPAFQKHTASRPSTSAAHILHQSTLAASGGDGSSLPLAASQQQQQHALIVFQLRRFLHALEGTCDGFLSALSLEHQKAIEEMVKADGIQKQMDEQKRADGEADSRPADSASVSLSGTTTLPQLARFETLARSLFESQQLISTPISELFAPVSSSNQPVASNPAAHIAAAYLLRVATEFEMSHIFLSQSLAADQSFQLLGPSAPHQWSLVLTYARALAERGQNLHQLALLFPATNSSRSLLVHLRLVKLPFPTCLIAYELGPSLFHPASPVKGSLPEAAFLSPLEAVGSSFEKSELHPLLAESHPVNQELKAFSSTYQIVRDESLLPEWHAAEATWNKIHTTSKGLEACFPSFPQLRTLYDPEGNISSGEAKSFSANIQQSPPSVASTVESTVSEASPRLVTAHIAHEKAVEEEKASEVSEKSIHPVPPNHPTADNGTTSFRRKSTGASRPPLPPQASLPNEVVPLLESLPVARADSFNQRTILPLSSHPSPAVGGGQAVELSMDTPRLQTDQSQTPRIEMRRTESNDLPPIDRRGSGTTLASKLKAAAPAHSAERSDSEL